MLVAISVSREFWAENRVSVMFPAGLSAPVAVVVNGKFEKLVPRPLPVAVDRVIDVMSMNPPIVRSVSPMWIARGDDGCAGGVCAGAEADGGAAGLAGSDGDSRCCA